MTVLFIVFLVVICLLLGRLKQVKMDYAQATFAAWRLLMLANNGDKLEDHLRQWSSMGATMSAMGESISPENRRVMKINLSILSHSDGKSWIKASEEYRAIWGDYISF